jgi:hypothetical protein
LRTGVERMTDLAELIRVEDRIIEVAAHDGVVARELLQRGRRRYLGLLHDEVLTAVRDEAGDLADRLRPLSEAPDLRAVGADVLILHGRAARWLWTPSDLRAVRIVAAPAGSWEVRLAGEAMRRDNQLRPLGVVDVGGEKYRFFEVPGKRAPRPRVYLSPVIGHAGLLRRLDEAGIRAVVLRWFEELPYVDPGEDLDLLVSDADVEKVRALITEEPGSLPIDLYSVTGLPGSDREGLPCYPPPLAQRIVDRAIRHPSGAYVPAPDDHLHSLAHHAVYHKGPTSGLPSAVIDSADEVAAEHDYGAVLTGLAKQLDVDLPSDLEGLDEYLEGVGWRPPMDTLRRLSMKNQWAKRRFFAEAPSVSREPEPAVFVLRSRALDVVDMTEVHKLLEHLGFEVVEHRALDQAAVARCATNLRGGNWGQGPYPTSGGTPASVLVALHYAPSPVQRSMRKKYPHLTNRYVLTAKERLRSLVNKRVAVEHRCNPIHSSDNEAEAWEYLAVAMPKDVSRFQALVEQRRAAYCTPQPVIEVLNRSHHGKTELVEYAGGLAVRKTFAPRDLAQHEREKELTRSLAGDRRIVPPIASGSNWIMRPYVRDRLRYDERSPRLIPLRILRGMVDILRAVHDAGYALASAKPTSFRMDDDGVKLVDLELLYKYPDEPPPFHRSYTWRGSPPSDGPTVSKRRRSHQQVWSRWTGMPIAALCYATPREQRVIRFRYLVRRVVRRGGGLIARIPAQLIKKAATVIRKARARGSAAVHSWTRNRAHSSLT